MSLAIVPDLPPDEGFCRTDGVGPFAINDASRIIVEDRSWGAMVAKMRADAGVHREYWREPLIRRFYPGVFIIWSHRLAHTLHIRGQKALAMVVMWACHALTGTEIRPGAVIGPGLIVVHPSAIVIGGGTVLGTGVQLYGSNTFGANFRDGTHGSPQVGDGVIMGAHALALGPVQIGSDVRVGAGSIVLTDVPAGAAVKGVPAK